MANGNDFYNLTSGQIAGARGGGKNLENMMRHMFSTLADAEFFGEIPEGEEAKSLSDFGLDWLTGGTGAFELGGWGESNVPLGTPFNWSANPEYNLENLTSHLEGLYGEEGTLYGETGQKDKGMKALLSLLKATDVGGLGRGYGQDVGDINAELQAQLTGLTSQYTGKQTKKGRYSSLMGTGKPKTSMDDYLSKYYGARDTSAELLGTAGGALEEDYHDKITKWLATSDPTSSMWG